MSHTADHHRDDSERVPEDSLAQGSAPVPDGTGRQHAAGAFDIRNIIGALMLAYGLLLTIYSFVGDQALDKTGDVNANLWAGLSMLLVGLGFMAWARLRPIIVPEHVEPHDHPPGH